MRTRLTIGNSERLEDVVLELADHVVLIGPNDPGTTTPLQALKELDPWSPEATAPDDVSDPIFRAFSRKPGSPPVLRKDQCHELITSMPVNDLDDEIRDMPGRIQAVADAARPAGGRRPARRQPSIRP